MLGSSSLRKPESSFFKELRRSWASSAAPRPSRSYKRHTEGRGRLPIARLRASFAWNLPSSSSERLRSASGGREAGHRDMHGKLHHKAAPGGPPATAPLPNPHCRPDRALGAGPGSQSPRPRVIAHQPGSGAREAAPPNRQREPPSISRDADEASRFVCAASSRAWDELRTLTIGAGHWAKRLLSTILKLVSCVRASVATCQRLCISLHLIQQIGQELLRQIMRSDALTSKLETVEPAAAGACDFHVKLEAFLRVPRPSDIRRTAPELPCRCLGRSGALCLPSFGGSALDAKKLWQQI